MMEVFGRIRKELILHVFALPIFLDWLNIGEG
jgi:hypothetical protein